MAVVFTNEENLQNISDSIRQRNGTQDSYTPSEMASAIQALSGEEGVFNIVSVLGVGPTSTGDVPLKQVICDMIYPVGSIYISADGTSPATRFGGTWQQIKDRFLLAAGDSYSAGSTGGEAAHTLTVSEMPSHTHSATIADPNLRCGENGDFANYNMYGSLGGWGLAAVSENNKGNARLFLRDTVNVAGTGGGAAHNNMPPYLTVYVWKRTA